MEEHRMYEIWASPLRFRKISLPRSKGNADAQRMTVDDVIASALAEQLAAWERLKQRATRGRREEYIKVLEKVPADAAAAARYPSERK
jgi:hypothetical protein